MRFAAPLTFLHDLIGRQVNVLFRLGQRLQLSSLGGFFASKGWESLLLCFSNLFGTSSSSIELSISRGGRNWSNAYATEVCFLQNDDVVGGLRGDDPEWRAATASTWNLPGSGDYETAGNWTGGVPNGSGAIADFSQVELNGDASVTLNSDVTLGQLLFGDTNLGTAGTGNSVPTTTLCQ